MITFKLSDTVQEIARMDGCQLDANELNSQCIALGLGETITNISAEQVDFLKKIISLIGKKENYNLFIHLMDHLKSKIMKKLGLKIKSPAKLLERHI